MASKNLDITTNFVSIRKSSYDNRVKLEERQKGAILPIVEEALKRIEKVTKTRSAEPKYMTLVISSLLEEYGLPDDKIIKTKVQYYLRSAKNIATKLGKANNRVTPDNMTPLAYSFVGEAKKKSMGLDAIYMKDLDSEMKNYIQERAEKIEAKSDLFDMLLICDYLMRRNAHKEWRKLMGMKVSIELGQPITKTKQALEDLVDAKVLLVDQVKRSTRGSDTICHLAYSIADYSRLNNQLVSGAAEKKYRQDTAAGLVVKESFIKRTVEAMSEHASMSRAEEMLSAIKTNSDGKGLGLLSQKNSKKDLTVNVDTDTLVNVNTRELKVTTDISEEDARCLEHIMRLMKGQQNKSDGGETQETIERLQGLLSMSQKENTDLRAELAKAESEMNKLRHRLKVQEEFNQAYASEARKSMNQLISSVSSVTEKYTQIPSKRVTPDDTAEFKNGIICAATEAQNRLRDFTYSKSVEPLKK